MSKMSKQETWRPVRGSLEMALTNGTRFLQGREVYDYLNELERAVLADHAKAEMAERLAEWAVVTHDEKGWRIGGQFVAGARDCTWQECRLCLVTATDGKSLEHGKGCPVSAFHALSHTEAGNG